MTGDALRAAQREFAKDPDARHRLLMLRLQPDAQQGQKDELNKVAARLQVKVALLGLISPWKSDGRWTSSRVTGADRRACIQP